MRNVKNRTEATARGASPPPPAPRRRRLSRRCPSETSGTGAMERLLCCLLGFPEKDAQVLRSLTRLFRPSLSADWAFEVGVSEDCDLLVCDLDDPGGRHAWNSPAPPGLLRAAASANDGGQRRRAVAAQAAPRPRPVGHRAGARTPRPPSSIPRSRPRRRAPGTGPRRHRRAGGTAARASAFFKPEPRARPAAPRHRCRQPGLPRASAAPDLSEWDRGGAETDATASDATRLGRATIRRRRQSRPSARAAADRVRRGRQPPPAPLRQRRAAGDGAGAVSPEPSPSPPGPSEAPHAVPSPPRTTPTSRTSCGGCASPPSARPPRPRRCSPRCAASAARTRRRCWKRPG